MSNDPKPTPPGRRSPPREHQFGPDRPGNRRGRPKGARNFKTIVEKVALERHRVRKDGRVQMLTTIDLLLHTLQTKALSGDVQAAVYLDRIVDRLQPDDPPGGRCFLVVPEMMTEEEWEKRYSVEGPLQQGPEG